MTSSLSEQLEPAPEVAIRHLSGGRAGHEQRVGGGRIAIGRGAPNQVAFDPRSELSVSHRHCEVRFEDRLPVLYDMGSLNGTFVNGDRVRRRPLRDGDEIGLGREGPRFQIHFSLTPADGRTTKEVPRLAMPESLRPVAPPRRRRPRGWMAGAAILLVVLGGAFWWLERRLDRLEAQPGTGISQGRQGGPAQSLMTHPAAGHLVFGVIRDESGRVLVRRELGAGALLSSGHLLTTRGVHDRLGVFLGQTPTAPGARASVEAGPGDCPDRARPVTGALTLPGYLTSLLRLEGDAELTGLLVGDALPARVRWEEPGKAVQEVEVLFLTNKTGTKPETDALAARMHLRGGPTTEGTPLISVAGEVVGLSIGAASPQQALPVVATPGVGAVHPEEAWQPLRPH